MAKTGVYKSEVRQARDALVAQGRHPSVDALRIALGNTGSKTTIHKYLKELEEDGGDADRKVSISEALQDLVARLAARLQEEAVAQIDAIRAGQLDQERRHAEALANARQESEQLRVQLQRTETAWRQQQLDHGATREALQGETVARATAEQRASDLKERLAENETHRLSLEEKHKHAREALEHYRQSVKEQRDQDQRRHEQQIQQLQAELRLAQQGVIVKQEEVTRLNQEGVRLVADLSHAKQALYDEQSNSRRLAQKLEAQQAVEQQAAKLGAQLGERDAQVKLLTDQLSAVSETAEGLMTRVRDLELALAQSQAKAEALQGVSTELRAYLDRREKPAASNQQEHSHATRISL